MADAKPSNVRGSRSHRATGPASVQANDPATELPTIASQPPIKSIAAEAASPEAASPEDLPIEHTDAALAPELAQGAEAADETEVDGDPLAALPAEEDPDLAALAADPALDEEELVEDLDAVVVTEDEEEEEDEALPPPSNRVAPRMPGHMPGVPNRPVMHARMPAKAEVFHEGDHVVYPTHGVGKVERIATEEIAGHKLELIHITFEENRMTLRVPVSKARSAGLRKLASRKMFDEAMTILKGRARIKRTMWSRRAQEYEAKINSGDPLAIAEVVRDLHRNSGQPDQSFSERQIYEAAMDRLAAELAALDKTDKQTAVTKLGDFLKTV